VKTKNRGYHADKPASVVADEMKTLKLLGEVHNHITGGSGAATLAGEREVETLMAIVIAESLTMVQAAEALRQAGWDAQTPAMCANLVSQRLPKDWVPNAR
jgi:hypothetical protein